ncbi:hypothetical protein B0H10DRAFT_2040881 [Mycena sp. CBHHK59/15]|nr:hypothetical protein B0H10DRAFT_2040881 [Mycena sp. CBHHK59/15]
MPLLTPSTAPPVAEYSTRGISNSNSTTLKNDAAPSGAMISPQVEQMESPSLSGPPSSTVSKVPLDIEKISADIASDLALTFIGHVLFLKNQVPFPITQLYRIPGGKSSARALKLRTDLLASFDTLSSHLDTTFTALSTAFARTSDLQVDLKPDRPTRRAYLAILVGPSIGSAKTKVIFAVDGMAVKIWGERDDDDSSDEDEESNDEDDEGLDDSDLSDTDSSQDGDSDSEVSSPPHSRSPSPSPPSTSPLPTPLCITEPMPSSTSREQTLRTANRLLSHTLSTAEHSMSAELGMPRPLLPSVHTLIFLAPSQTHILIRAPRRFDHPAWIPRQTVSATLDTARREFREEAGDITERPRTVRKTRPRTQKAEGVWVTCQTPGVEFADEAAEEDEMIWWSWDRKIVGFSDW